MIVAEMEKAPVVGFPVQLGLVSRGAVATRAVFTKSDRPLLLWLHQLGPDAGGITWDFPVVDHAVYVWAGEIESQRMLVQTDGAVIVEHEARAYVRAGSARGVAPALSATGESSGAAAGTGRKRARGWEPRDRSRREFHDGNELRRVGGWELPNVRPVAAPERQPEGEPAAQSALSHRRRDPRRTGRRDDRRPAGFGGRGRRWPSTKKPSTRSGAPKADFPSYSIALPNRAS